MAVQLPKLSVCQPGLALSPLPTWVLHVDDITFVWANPKAVALWNADSLDQLLTRDLVTGMPAAVAERTRHVFDSARAGRRVREEWVLYPKGKATPVVLDLQAVDIGAGQVGILNQATPVDVELPEVIRRNNAIFRHSTVISALVLGDGRITSQNPAAREAFGESASWFDWCVDKQHAESLLRDALGGDCSRRPLLEVRALDGARWHIIQARSVRDPVEGELGVLVEHIDATARIEAEHLAEARGRRIDGLTASLEVVERQRREILGLSAPMLEVARGVLAIPLIGRLSETRAEALTTKLLDAVAARGIRRVILDVTGVAGLDDGTARYLHSLIRALRLLGAEPVLTGVRPALALEFTSADFDLGDVPIFRTLASGLKI